MKSSWFIGMLLVGWAASASPSIGSALLLDGYAAIVNDKVITVGDVLAAMAAADSGRDSSFARDRRGADYEKARQQLIENELIVLDFDRQGGQVPDHALENHINTIIHERFQNDRTAFLRALAEERLTFSDWRRQMKNQLIVQLMRQREVHSRVWISPLDLQRAYEQRRGEWIEPERVRLRTLVFPAGTTDSARLEDVRDRLRRGRLDWNDAATEGGEGNASEEELETASLAAPIRQAVARLSPGEISGPISWENSWILVQLVERKPERIRPFSEVAPELERELRRAEADRLHKLWLDSLRARYHVQTFAQDLLFP